MEYENLNFSKCTKVPPKKPNKTAKEFGCNPDLINQKSLRLISDQKNLTTALMSDLVKSKAIMRNQ